MNQNNKKSTGDLEWLKDRLHYQWEIIRRDPIYIKFCQDHNYAFDQDKISVMDTSRPPLSQKAEEIKNCYGLEMIYHPSVDIPKERILDWPVFKKERAVDYEPREKKPGIYTPIWEDHYIKLTIDISKTNGQIKREFWELVDWAREVSKTKKKTGKKGMRFDFDDDIFKVWDLREKGKNPTEIIKELWPKEYAEACNKDEDEDEKVINARYEAFVREYKEKGFDDWEADRKALAKTTKNPSSKRIKLYRRVQDKLNRMEKLLQMVRGY